MSVKTSFLASVARLRGEMNSRADLVITGQTTASSFVRSLVSSRALYADMAPVTPSTIFLSLRIIFNSLWGKLSVESFPQDFWLFPQRGRLQGRAKSF